MFDEMIQEYLRLEGVDELTADDCAADLVDNACAQGMIDENDEIAINLAHKQISERIKGLSRKVDRAR